MSQMDAALEFLNDIAEYRMNGVGPSADHAVEIACSACAQYVVRAMTPEALTPGEVTIRAMSLRREIDIAVSEGQRIDALSFCR